MATSDIFQRGAAAANGVRLSSDFRCGGVRRGVSFPSTKYRSLVRTAQRHALPRYRGAASFSAAELSRRESFRLGLVGLGCEQL